MSKIFLIDDHAMVREGLRAVLTSAGHTVVGESDTPVDAAKFLQQSGAEILILDIHLKSLSGLDVLLQIQEHALTVRTIVLTMSSEPLHLRQALQAGALGYVLKGSPTRELVLAIDSAMQDLQFLSADVADFRAVPRAEPGILAPEHRLARLSARELQILDGVVRGKTSAAIGLELGLSPKTVETYRSRLMTKLELSDLPALVRLALQCGILEL